MIFSIDGVEYVLLPRKLTDYQKSKLGSEEAVLLQQEVLDQLVLNRTSPDHEAQSAIIQAIVKYNASKNPSVSDDELIIQMRRLGRAEAVKLCMVKKGISLRESVDFWSVHCQATAR